MGIGFNQKFQSSQAHKVERFLKTYGEMITFMRQSLNEFGEPDPDGEFALYQLLGVYHEEVPHMYVVETTANASTHRQKPSSMILIKATDADMVKIHDLVSYHGRCYRVIEKTDVSERSFAVNVSIEEVQPDGNQLST